MALVKTPAVGWAKTWGGSSDDSAFATAVDKSGNIYTTGFFNDTVDFDPGSGSDLHTSLGNTDIFLSQFLAPDLQRVYLPVMLR